MNSFNFQENDVACDPQCLEKSGKMNVIVIKRYHPWFESTLSKESNTDFQEKWQKGHKTKILGIHRFLRSIYEFVFMN